MIKLFFPLQLGLAFIAGTLWYYFSVAIGLRLSNKFGAFIGGLPSTALLSLFFIGLTQKPDVVATVTTIFPLSIAASGCFFVVFALLVRRGFTEAIFSGILAWVIFSLIIIMASLKRFSFNSLILTAIFIIIYVILEYLLKVRLVPIEKSRYPRKFLVMRSLFGGLIVMITLVIAKVGGAVLAGLFASFPAMFIAMLMLTYRAHGIEYSRWMTKTLMISGVITIAVFACTFKVVYLLTGVWFGTVLSFSLSAISAYFLYRYILPQLK